MWSCSRRNAERAPSCVPRESSTGGRDCELGGPSDRLGLARRVGVNRYRPRAVLVLSVLLLGVMSATMEGVDPGERIRAAPEMRLKAAILFNLAKYVEWPAAAFKGPTSALTFGILGDDPFGNEFDAVIAGRTIHGRPVAVKRSRSLGDLTDCHVIYLNVSEEDRLASILSALNGRPVLTVGESAGFLPQGGMIRLFVDESRVRFEVNLQASNRGGLKLSSQMLQLARSIRNGQEKEE